MRSRDRSLTFIPLCDDNAISCPLEESCGPMAATLSGFPRTREDCHIIARRTLMISTAWRAGVVPFGVLTCSLSLIVAASAQEQSANQDRSQAQGPGHANAEDSHRHRPGRRSQARKASRPRPDRPAGTRAATAGGPVVWAGDPVGSTRSRDFSPSGSRTSMSRRRAVGR